MASNQVWTPVPDGEYPLGDVTQNCTEDCIRITSVGHNCILSITDCGDRGHDVYLGKKYRLCQLVESDAPAAVTIPSEVREAIEAVMRLADDAYNSVFMYNEIIQAWLDSQPADDA